MTSRREFLGTLAGAAFVTGCAGRCPLCCREKMGLPAVQLYSIREYINPAKGGVGLEKALEAVAKIGYKGIEFAGYYGFDAKQIKKMLDDNGLVACGTHVGRDSFAPEKIQETIDFNLGFGNSHLICPGGGMWPDKTWTKGNDAWWEMIVDFFNEAADTANKCHCTLGYHNHTREFEVMTHGTTMWNYFFSHTRTNVCMEQDVGWTVAAGSDPCEWYRKFPHRSPTLHAKENVRDAVTKKDAPNFEGILGQPGTFADGKAVQGVDWDKLFPVTDADGVKWYVVECERNAKSLKAITDSFAFLKAKGRA